jgi:hypothetical protein
MTTATGAYNVIRARLEANVPTSNGSAVALRWQGETGGPLPNTPSPFVYVEFIADPGALVGIGGGRGNNIYRNPARIDAFCFVPRDWGLTYATDLAEAVATLFRSYRDDDISCFEASVIPLGAGASIKPPGLDSEVDNYYAAVAECELTFDQVG